MNDSSNVTITKNLENWYIIDSILFNDHARNVIKEDSVFKEYVSLKASLLSNLYEYWQHVNYSPVDSKIPSNVKTLQESAKISARRGKTLASELISRDSFKAKLKTHILEESKKHNVTDLNTFQSKIIQEKFKQLALDNCLIGLPLLESKNVTSVCNFECKILENAHKVMRDKLVKLSMTVK